MNHACETLLLDKYGIFGILKFLTKRGKIRLAYARNPRGRPKLLLEIFFAVFRGHWWLQAVASFPAVKWQRRDIKCKTLHVSECNSGAGTFHFARAPRFRFLYQIKASNICIIIRIRKLWGGCACSAGKNSFPSGERLLRGSTEVPFGWLQSALATICNAM